MHTRFLPESPQSLFQHQAFRSTLLLLPVVAFIVVFFCVPIIGMVIRSLYIDGEISFAHYIDIFTSRIYSRIIFITFQIAVTVTLACLLIGFPLAYWIANASRRGATIMLAIVLLPFFTSVLVRTYGWMVILRPDGIADMFFSALSLDVEPLIYSRTAVIIGLVYALCPYMILSLFSVMKGIPSQLIHAAHSMGASGFQAFYKVYLPQCAAGIFSGSLLVFIICLGYFITPRLLGGPRDQTLPSTIDYQIDVLLNWGLASAMATTLLVTTLVLFAIYGKFLGVERLLSRDT